MIKTYRGLLPDGTQERIRLHTPNGMIGYKILKFAVFPNLPGTATIEGTLKIYSVEQSSIDNVVDFSNNVLLAASYYMDQDNPQYTGYTTTIFDREIFNQDIYITAVDTDGSAAMNYYIELEQFKLTETEALVAIIKDLREEQ